MISRATSNYKIDCVKVIDETPDKIVPNDMEHFGRLFVDDAWNAAIYGQILQHFTSVQIIKLPELAKVDLITRKKSVISELRNRLIKLISTASQWGVQENEAFLISTYLPLYASLKLQKRLGQIPRIWRAISTPKVKIACEQRLWALGNASSDDFVNVARAMIPRNIPVLYLEGYSELRLICRNLPWPKKPRIIFTSNSHNSDDVFKAWLAEKTESNTVLAVGQHGGGYGISRMVSLEDHEVAISDIWLSWGWADCRNVNIKPTGNIKMVGKKIKYNPKGGATIVEAVGPRYSYLLHSIPISANQWQNYIEEQHRFIEALPEKLRAYITIRLYPADWGWDQKQRWKDRFPQIKLDEGMAPLDDLIKKSRLYISTYNATTFLESISMNMPTIIFWNPKYWELRNSAIPYFDQLKSVGIFHESPESAAIHMAAVWDDVNAWWFSHKVQKILALFRARYCNCADNLIDLIEVELKKAIAAPRVSAVEI
jgi:putative transferase (TIGR04331 family)